jgi:hypothetical protein
MKFNIIRKHFENKITLLKDVSKNIIIYKKGEYKYFQIPLIQFEGIENFLLNLDNDKIYILIPFISPHGNINDPILVLSKQLLITKNSNPRIVLEFLADQLDKAIIDFGFSELNKYYLVFKYKAVTLHTQTKYK